mmetsp:Transcript_26145/g.34354  ORF Transcript_26145/g.34354 Transcript_26145/m.34354 type:complete len:169 (-) Transcript_26145:148-654(-)
MLSRNMIKSVLSRPLLGSINSKTPFLARSLATVAENTVNVTFVNHEGSRLTVPALVGQSLFEVARMHKLDMEGPCAGGGHASEVVRSKDWTEPLYGEGPTCAYCHVMVPGQWAEALPGAKASETNCLNSFYEDEDISPTSRLACQITLTKELNGITVFIPDAPPSDCP